MLTFKIVDSTDEDFDTADIDDGNNVDKNSVEKQEDTVKGVEHNGGNSTSKEPTHGDTICFFFVVFNADLPTIAFLERGFVDLCHGCDYANRYFYQKISTASKITPA